MSLRDAPILGTWCFGVFPHSCEEIEPLPQVFPATPSVGLSREEAYKAGSHVKSGPVTASPAACEGRARPSCRLQISLCFTGKGGVRGTSFLRLLSNYAKEMMMIIYLWDSHLFGRDLNLRIVFKSCRGLHRSRGVRKRKLDVQNRLATVQQHSLKETTFKTSQASPVSSAMQAARPPESRMT